MGFIVIDVAPAALLVAAKNQANLLFQGHARQRQGLHGHQGGNHRALVVAGAPAINAVALPHGGKGRRLPAVPGGHHVQVAQHGNGLLALAHLRVAGVAVIILHREAQGANVRHGGVQHPPYLRTEGRAGSGLRLYRGHGNPAVQQLHQRGLQALQSLGNFRIHHHIPPCSQHPMGQRTCPGFTPPSPGPPSAAGCPLPHSERGSRY